METEQIYVTLQRYAEAHLSLYFKRVLPHSEEHTSRSAHLSEGLLDTLMMLVLLQLRDLNDTLGEISEDTSNMDFALRMIKKEYCGE
jgi:hypothetical protein